MSIQVRRISLAPLLKRERKKARKFDAAVAKSCRSRVSGFAEDSGVANTDDGHAG